MQIGGWKNRKQLIHFLKLLFAGNHEDFSEFSRRLLAPPAHDHRFHEKTSKLSKDGRAGKQYLGWIFNRPNKVWICSTWGNAPPRRESDTSAAPSLVISGKIGLITAEMSRNRAESNSVQHLQLVSWKRRRKAAKETEAADLRGFQSRSNKAGTDKSFLYWVISRLFDYSFRTRNVKMWSSSCFIRPQWAQNQTFQR